MNNQELLSALKSANSILMCTHISPDGDAIGSMLAAGRMLMHMGKQITMVCDDPVPGRLSFLPGADWIVQPDALAGKCFDLAFALDCSDEGRMGLCANAYNACPVRAQLDHHKTNPLYAHYNEVDGHASSTGCMVWRLLRAMQIVPDPEMAACIYTAISTDTGNFSLANTDEETFACAAAMVNAGFDLSDLSRRVHLLREEAHVRLLGCALRSLRLFANGQCASMTLTQRDYETSSAGSEHCDGIVNYALNIPGVKMSYLLDQRDDKITKISFRAIAPYQVSGIAAQLGGGGHLLAAGCRTAMPVQEAVRCIEEQMLRQIGDTQ